MASIHENDPIGRKSAAASAGRAHVTAARAAAASGRLVAITATGPIRQAEAEIELVPLSVGLAFAQELALRALKSNARVVSTLANEVSGDTALTEWWRVSGLLSAPLVNVSPRVRLAFLGAVLDYARWQGNVNGIEPVVGAAINAAWPWLEWAALERTLGAVSRHLRASEFAATTAIPVLDPNNRTYTIFAPGQLTSVDLGKWLDWRAAPGAYDPWETDIDLGAIGGMPSRKSKLGWLGGNDGRGFPGGGNSSDDAFEGLLARLGLSGHGPKLGGPGFGDGRGLPGSGRRDDGFGGLSGLGWLGPGSRAGGLWPGDVGGGLGDLTGSGGGRGGERDDPFGPGGPLGGMPGHHGLDLGNVGGPGGLSGFDSTMGPGGASTPESDKKEGNTDHAIAWGAFALGGAMVSAGPNVLAKGIGLIVIAIGVAEYKAGSDKIDKATQDAKDAEKQKDKGTKEDKEEPRDGGEIDEPIDLGEIDDPPPPKPKDGGTTGLYPDPFGGDGGGNPAAQPRDDGSVGDGKPHPLWSEVHSNPATLWDEHGGGGTPNTIWDENGGGGTPTTTGVSVRATMLAGRGLLADVVQIGPSTFAF